MCHDQAATHTIAHKIDGERSQHWPLAKKNNTHDNKARNKGSTGGAGHGGIEET